MTHKEITNISNEHKNEYNKYNKQVENYDNSIMSFFKFYNYLNTSKKKSEKLYKSTLISGYLFGLITAISAFISLPVSIVFLIISTITFERCFFFNRVLKKFNHCVSYLSKVITNLSTKQLDYAHKRDLEMEEIKKLEKMVPEEIIRHVGFQTLTDENLNAFEL